MDTREMEQPFVFGLDIGTRNVVGTVGYLEDKTFRVIAHYSMEHETRAMLDGQIHDIGRVAATISQVKGKLEQQMEGKLSNVCIAAAGRVLKTETVKIEYEYPEETTVTKEDVHTLNLLGIDKAQSILKEKNDTRYKFYCVGYSVVKYYLNDEPFSNLEGHKAEKIAEDVIVTFLPEDVVDGLYAACNQAGLFVANMTLEPIAAIDVAIPENYRMLNIALVDVGAGTSDISVTKDGSIIAYGMIPLAGDEISEVIVQNYLVDFVTAERMKLASTTEEEIAYEDIMGIAHVVKAEEIWQLTAPIVDRITTDIAAKIKELNGETTVSATFVVGGGGKIHGFTELLAEKLDLPKERVALRGEEVLGSVIFEQEDVKKDPLLVTPIGICLNYYDQKNSFIMVHFNGERIKLYDNSRLTIVDAAMAAGFPNDQLFPKRGKEITFTVNGRTRIARGEAGESAIVTVNDQPVSLNEPLMPNSYITITPSTAGDSASCTIEDLAEYTTSYMNFHVNGRTIKCPKFVEVNGKLEMSSYRVKEGDAIETRNFYTVEQIADFMDMEINESFAILVNNRPAELDTMVYENFAVDFTAEPKMHEEGYFAEETPEAEEVQETETDSEADAAKETESLDPEKSRNEADSASQADSVKPADAANETGTVNENAGKTEKEDATKAGNPHMPMEIPLSVTINGETVILTGKTKYIFVDVFDFIEFNLAEANGRAVVTNVNGKTAQYTQPLAAGDDIEIYWKEN